MATNKKRASNFTSDEEYILLELIKKYKNIIECKRSGAHTWQEKEHAWGKIESEFNCAFGTNGSKGVKTLKLKYANMKKKTKEKFSRNKCELQKTGGGVASQTSINGIDETIKTMIGPQLDGLANNYDDDATENIYVHYEEDQEEDTFVEGGVMNQSIQDDEAVTEVPTNEDVDDIEDSQDLPRNRVRPEVRPDQSRLEEDETGETSNWASYASSSLRQPVSKKLKRAIPKPKKDLRLVNGTKTYTGLHQRVLEEKLSFIQLQREKFLEKHSLEMELLKKKIDIVNKKLQL